MRFPPSFSVYQEANAAKAVVQLPTADPDVAYVITHISAKVIAFAGPPGATQTFNVRLVDTGAPGSPFKYAFMFIANAIGAIDTLDIDLMHVTQQGGAPSVEFSGAGLANTLQTLVVTGTVA